MFHKNVGAFADEEVPDDAAAHAREHTYEDGEERVAGAHAGVYAEHGEDGKSHRVHYEQTFFGAGNVFGYARNKHDERSHRGGGSVQRIGKDGRRRNVEDEVAQNPPAYGGGEANNHDAEDIHLLVHRGNHTRRSKRHRPNNFKNNHKCHTQTSIHQARCGCKVKIAHRLIPYPAPLTSVGGGCKKYAPMLICWRNNVEKKWKKKSNSRNG